MCPTSTLVQTRGMDGMQQYLLKNVTHQYNYVLFVYEIMLILYGTLKFIGYAFVIAYVLI